MTAARERQWGIRMSKSVPSLLLAALIALTGVTADEATAAKKRRSAEMSASEAAAEVQRRTGGQALGVEEENQDGRKVFRVRVLTPDGRVREIAVDPRSRDN